VLIGHLAESAIFSQWQHAPSFKQLRYARWRNDGEVDIAYLRGPEYRPAWIGEIKWSDRASSHFQDETRSISTMRRKHRSTKAASFTTRTVEEYRKLEGR
jgi:uncharacterized protein